VKVINRHGKNILTNKMLGISTKQLEALKLMLKSLGDIYRFGGVPNMTRKNSVREHTQELMKLADFVAESLDNEEDRQKLRLLALVHDMGEVCGELTVVHDDLNGEKLISPRQKEIVEFEVFQAFYSLAKEGTEDYLTLLELTRQWNDPLKLSSRAKDIMSTIISSEEDLNIFKTIQGKGMNKMIPILLKALDRAEGTYYFCRYAEDIDLTNKDFMQKAVEYNMASLYKGLPKHLGGSDYVTAFKKTKTIVKAAVRRYKHLCRFDKLSWFDVTLSGINDFFGRYVTWGPDELVYYIRYWNLGDMFKVLTGEYKVYNSLEEIYNAK